MHEFEYANVFGYDHMSFNEYEIALRKEALIVCAGDLFTAYVLEYVLSKNAGRIRAREEGPQSKREWATWKAAEQSYYDGDLDLVLDVGVIHKCLYGIVSEPKIRKAIRFLKSKKFMAATSYGKYHLNLGGLWEAFALAGKEAKCAK